MKLYHSPRAIPDGFPLPRYTIPQNGAVQLLRGFGAALLGNFGPYTRAVVYYSHKQPVVIRMKENLKPS